jgi:hypothetical protein
VTAAEIERLPVQIAPDRHVFLSRRFDRPEQGGRIHRAMAAWPEDPRDPARMAALRAHVERLPLLAEAG